MDLGWVVTVVSPTNPSVQVSIIGNHDMAARASRQECLTRCRARPFQHRLCRTTARSRAHPARLLLRQLESGGFMAEAMECASARPADVTVLYLALAQVFVSQGRDGKP
jgi:hypothetical protein